ncbi:MAG: aminoacyl-tRNA hydrolase [Actinobacteria bacterium]|nr:aminoacyl-tRNA hydrolase [Actinomycetota bacterium]
MFLVLGLGNPGEHYRWTRHNAGFWAVEMLARDHGASFRRGRGYDLAEVDFYTERVFLARPLTYMNLSGKAARRLRRKLRVEPQNILVIHDDIDLRPGTIRIRMGGSSGGHLGVQSVIDHLGTRDFPRVRVGVGRPPEGMDPADYVLAEMKGEELEEFLSWCERAAEAAEAVIMDGLDTAMNIFNASRTP